MTRPQSGVTGGRDRQLIDEDVLDLVIETRFPTILKIIRHSGVVFVTSVEVALIRHEYRRVMAGDWQ
jgi:hypothetical protein